MAQPTAEQITHLDHGSWLGFVRKNNSARAFGVAVERVPRLLIQLHRVIRHVLFCVGRERSGGALARIINLQRKRRTIERHDASGVRMRGLPSSCLARFVLASIKLW
jgi:hypothetical protein